MKVLTEIAIWDTFGAEMRLYASRLVLLATAIIAAGPSICAVAEEGKAEQPAQVSTAKNGNATNSPSFKPKQNGLRQLEQDLFRPFEAISPKGSLDGAFVPALPQPQQNAPAVQSKRARELLEHRRDWVFETPEEILAAPSTDDILNRPGKNRQSDGQSKLSPMERYYQRLYTRENKDSSRKSDKRDQLAESQKPGLRSDDPEAADEDADLPLNVRETQREMRRLLAPKERKEDSSTESASAFTDVFGFGKKTQSREEMEIQRERMNRYKALIGLPVTPSLETDPLKPFRDIVGTSPKYPGSLPTMDSLGTLPQQNLFGIQSGSASTPNSKLLPDGAVIHTTPSLAPVSPKIEPPRTLPPPVTFSAPRRPF